MSEPTVGTRQSTVRLVRVCNNCQQPESDAKCPEDRDGIHIFAVPNFVEVEGGGDGE